MAVAAPHLTFWISRLPGDRYGGRYDRAFRTQSAAQEALQQLRAIPPLVRHKPTHPDTSVIDAATLSNSATASRNSR